jgi:TetR/AcrR family transcriptional repressor of lmrAB and yxaGH operons
MVYSGVDAACEVREGAVEGAKKRLITCTIALLRRRGVGATGVADIIKLSGAARRSLYNHFPDGKMQLMVEATRSAGADMTNAITQFTAADEPLDSLSAFIAYWKSMMEADDFRSGCPIAMAALGSFDTPELAREAATVFSSWNDTLSEQLRRSGLPVTSAASLSSFTVSAVEGAIVQCIAYRSTSPLDGAHEHLAATLKLHLSAPLALAAVEPKETQ